MWTFIKSEKINGDPSLVRPLCIADFCFSFNTYHWAKGSNTFFLIFIPWKIQLLYLLMKNVYVFRTRRYFLILVECFKCEINWDKNVSRFLIQAAVLFGYCSGQILLNLIQIQVKPGNSVRHSSLVKTSAYVYFMNINRKGNRIKDWHKINFKLNAYCLSSHISDNPQTFCHFI